MNGEEDAMMQQRTSLHKGRVILRLAGFAGRVFFQLRSLAGPVF